MSSLRQLSYRLAGLLLFIASISFGATNAQAQIYLSDFNNSWVISYTDSGQLSGYPLIDNLSYPQNVQISGSDIFVANYDSGQVGEYSALNGSVINSDLANVGTGLEGIAVVGSNLYATNYDSSTVSEYTLGSTPGTVTSSTPNLLTNLGDPNLGGGPTAISVAGPYIYVTNQAAGTIGEYTTTGQTINSSLITGLNFPTAMTLQGNELFVTDVATDSQGRGSGGISEFTLDPTTGSVISSAKNLISGIDISGGQGVYGIAASGGDIYAVSLATDSNNLPLSTVGEWTLSGTPVNTALFQIRIGLDGIAIGNPGPVTATTTTTQIEQQQSYASVAPVTSVGGLGTVTTLVGGTATSEQHVAISTTDLATQYTSLASDVVSVSGIDPETTDSSVAHNTFALQLTFDLNAANQVGGAGAMTLLWLDPTTQKWVNAILGDIGTNVTDPDFLDFNGSFADFELKYNITNANLSNYLGAYGVDSVNDTVWAVINHNSTFSTGDLDVPPQETPEPSVSVLLLVGAIALLIYRRRSRSNAAR